MDLNVCSYFGLSFFWLKSYLGHSEHCGSIRPRVSQFLVGFLFLVSTHFCFGLVLMHLAHRIPTHPCSSLLRILILSMALSPTLMVWAPAPEVPRMTSSMPFFQNLYTSKSKSRKFLLPRLGCPAWFHISRKHLEIFRLDSLKLNRISTPSLHVCARSRHMQPQHPRNTVRQGSGLHSNKLTGPQLQGPMAQDHLLTIEIRYVDLMLSQAPRMNMREVPSYYGSHVNSTTLALLIGSIIFGKNPTCQPTINLLRFIVRQVPCRSGLYLKHEANVKTLLLDIKMMVFPKRLTVLLAASQQLLLSASPDQMRTERSASNSHTCGERRWLINSKLSSLMGMTKVQLSSQRSTPAHKS